MLCKIGSVWEMTTFTGFHTLGHDHAGFQTLGHGEIFGSCTLEHSDSRAGHNEPNVPIEEELNLCKDTKTRAEPVPVCIYLL